MMVADCLGQVSRDFEEEASHILFEHNESSMYDEFLFVWDCTI
jgi:hypothetical protein